MSGNLFLLTVLFIMCYFIKKGRNYAVTTITRAHRDYFTDVCQNCYKYGAEEKQGICECEPKSPSAGTGSLFLGKQSHCTDQDALMTGEGCQRWKRDFVEVIDTEGTNSYIFDKGSTYPSYQLEPLISYHNITTGEWQLFNLSGNVLELQNGSDSLSLQIKVTQVSQNLTKFKGYVMKLGLKRTRLDGITEESCLLFKAKGEIRFALHCIPKTTPVSMPTDIPTTTITPSPSTTTVTPTVTSSSTTSALHCSIPTTTPVSTTTGIPTTTITPSPSTTTVTPTVTSSSTTSALHCSIPTTTPVSTTTGIPTTTITPSPSTTTVTPTVSSSTTTTAILQPGIIVAIVLVGIAFVLSLIGAVLVVYRYTYLCRPRELQARNPDHDVVSNSGPQTYRIQEEPIYVDIPDNSPNDKGSGGSSTNEWEEQATVLLNPNVYEARFSVQRRTIDPLPSRPELARNTDTQVDAGAVFQNVVREAIGEAGEDSIVFKNPKVEEASSSSLPRSENDSTKLSGEHEQEGHPIGDQHHHHVEDDIDNSTVDLGSEGAGEDLDYQGLMQGKRAHSVFICPSCNENPDYQRLYMPHNCPHGAKDKPNESKASFYESLRGLEPGSRESVYATPTCIAEEVAVEDKGNRNSEKGEGPPEYHTLEQEETVPNKDLSEPVNHDYSVLEGPGETGDKVEEPAKDSISRDPEQTSEDSDLSLEPSKILHMEDNPAYAKPWKIKEEPELPLEPSDFHNIENNPAHSTPWRTKTAEPCARTRAYSV